LKNQIECLSSLLDEELFGQGPVGEATLNAQLEEDGCAALHVASENSDIDAVDLLLLAGAGPNVVDNDGCTPLVVSLSADPEELQEGESEMVTSIVNNLLEAKADPNIADTSGATPLAAAIQHGWEEVRDLHDL